MKQSYALYVLLYYYIWYDINPFPFGNGLPLLHIRNHVINDGNIWFHAELKRLQMYLNIVHKHSKVSLLAYFLSSSNIVTAVYCRDIWEINTSNQDYNYMLVQIKYSYAEWLDCMDAAVCDLSATTGGNQGGLQIN